MADLDFSDLLVDPDLSDNFNVLRRAETVGTNGRTTVTETTYSGVVGVLTPSSPQDLKIVPEDQLMERHLTITTKFRLQGPSPGVLPDYVQWGGDTFVVIEIEPYTHFGGGFVKAVCGSIDTVDQPNT